MQLTGVYEKLYANLGDCDCDRCKDQRGQPSGQ